jgi:hypothetical protein
MYIETKLILKELDIEKEDTETQAQAQGKKFEHVFLNFDQL